MVLLCPVAHDAAVSLNDVRTSDPEAESSKIDLVVEVSTNGETVGELATAGEILTRVELDLACASEKLINLNLLMMHEATKEGDFEPFASSKGDASDYSAKKALEFDLLSGVLNSEVTDVDKLITNLEVDIRKVRDTISPHANVGETFIVMNEKLCDCEKSLKQLKDQVSEIREQSTRFCRTLSCLNREERQMLDIVIQQEAFFMEEEAMDVYERWFAAENASEVFMGISKELLGRIQVLQFNLNGSMKREADLSSKLEKSVEQQRHILRMVEKSLARELDLEKKVTESRQVEDELIHKLLSAEQEAFCTEEEVMDVYERWFAAENAAEVFMGISKELLGSIQVLQFNLNGSMKRDADLSSKLENSVEQQRHILRMVEKSLARELDLEKKVTESRQVEDEFIHKLLSAEQEAFFMEEEAMVVYERWFGAENAAEVFMVISKELLGRIRVLQFNLNGSMKREAYLSSKLENFVELLESKESALQKFNSSSTKHNEFRVAQTDNLKDSSTEAENNLILANSEVFALRKKVFSLEKQLKESEEQNSSSSEISDMENVINNLRERLSKANSMIEIAEAKCALLTETNTELNEELGKFKDINEKEDSLERRLRESDLKLRHAVASADASHERQNMLYSTIRDMDNLIEDLKSKLSKEESQADSAEDKCSILSESNADLNEELSFFRSSLEASLRQLRESDLKLQHAVASADASQEKQNVLYSTIRDMDNLIEDLKSELSKAKSRVDSAEDKCITLSESNADLNEELSFLRSRLESSEASLRQLRESDLKLQHVVDNLIEGLKSKLSKEESRADSAEDKCSVLSESNADLNEELSFLRSSLEASLRQLRESDLKLQHAVASADASQEKQNVLYSTIRDMDNLIEDLKSELSKAESRVDSAEDKCITLSESNADLNEELSFLRSRLESSEASLRQLRESDLKLQHVVDNLIEGLKSKLSKEESRADSAENKCSILSESNADLNEELSFLRSRLESLEASLRKLRECDLSFI